MSRIGNWQLTGGGGADLDLGGPWQLTHANGLTFAGGEPRVELTGDTPLAGASWSITIHPDGIDRRCETGGFELIERWRPHFNGDWISVELTLRNLGPTVGLARLAPFNVESVGGGAPALDRVFHHGPDMAAYTALHPLGGRRTSSDVIGFSSARGEAALVIGFGDLGRAGCEIEVEMTDAAIGKLTARCVYDDIPLATGAELTVPALHIGVDAGLMGLLRYWAARVAATMGARIGPVSSGWCSWYYYYGTETEADIDANVEALAREPWREWVDVIQIDDGWNLPEPGAPRVWGDWLPGAKFSHDMRATAGRIRAAGFVPGLWLAPFSVEPASKLRAEHPEWLVQGEDGPAEFWGVHALDLTHPEALEFLRETFTRVFDEWGFGYVKIDFLMHAVQPGRRHDPGITRAAAWRRGLAVIREVAGDRFVLCCGSPMGPAVGLCDGMRIGYDVSSRWSMVMNPEGWQAGNCCIRAGMQHTIWRQWMHNIWWQNDPDCLVVRGHGSEPEQKLFADHVRNLGIETPFGLSEEEAAAWVRMVWLSGTMTLISENINDVEPERVPWLERAFPLNPEPAQVLDWYEDLEVSVWLRHAPRLIGVFNLSDQPRRVRVPAERLGLGAIWRMHERFSDERFEGAGDDVEFPELAPHAGRVWVAQA